MRFPLLLGLLFFALISYAQPCPPGDLLLFSQNDIDSFAIKYPDCTTISGDVRIASEGIKNLSGFNQIEVIYGTFNIARTSLKTLGGFQKLKYLSGYVSIAGNDSLENLMGFPPLLDTIRWDFIINNNTNLKSLKGLDNLVSVHRRFQIGWPHHEFDQPYIKNLEGLSSIKDIRILILKNVGLESLDGIESIEHIDHFRMVGLEKLKNISALKNCQIINEISIGGASNLESLDGLQGVQSLSSTLALGGLAQIEDLHPIEGMDLTQAKKVIIASNANLSECAVSSICQAIEQSDSVLIINNGQGCHSVQVVADQCTSNSKDASFNILSLYPNPAKDQIHLPVNNLPYTIINTQGKAIQNGRVEGQRIPIESLPTGIYILQVNDDQKIYQAKFVKE